MKFKGWKGIVSILITSGGMIAYYTLKCNGTEWLHLIPFTIVLMLVMFLSKEKGG